MRGEAFGLSRWLNAGNSLLSCAKEFLGNASDSALVALASKIPESMQPNQEPVKLVFAGQYSAGKSTLVKMLTGRQDIAIGEGITTGSANSYEWGGITVIDTPGIDTKIRPDHDEITYNAIANADLVVFVTTNELFDSHLAEHFRDLAITRHKAPEMMLVVNKMSRCAKGNTSAAQNVIKEDLGKVLTPYSPEDLRITFTDAKSAESSQSETDEEEGQILWEISGIDDLTREMNAFVRDKGLKARYTTALYTLEQVLQEALARQSGSDSDLAGAEEILLQRRRALSEAETGILRSVENELQKTASAIRDIGRQESAKIHAGANAEAINADMRAAQASVEQMAEQLARAIEAAIGKQMENLEVKMQAIASSEFAKKLFPRLLRRIEQASISPETVQKLSAAARGSTTLGKFLLENSVAPKTGGIAQLFRFNQYSGSNIHQAVKSIGKFMGVKFKPWGAVKWTRNIANVGRGLAIVGTVVTFALQFKEDSDAQKLEVELRESRASVHAGFNEAASAIEMHYDKMTRAYVAETISGEIANVDTKLAELRNLHETKDKMFNRLVEMLEETRGLIRQIHEEKP